MGTEAFWVPVAIAAASGGAQFANQRAASSRENAAQTQSIINQGKIQQKATGQVDALTKQIAQNSPAQLQGKATGDYVDQLRKNSAGATQGPAATPANASGPISSLVASAGANPRYAADTANAQAEVGKYGDTMAGQMGSIDAAVRQRQNEGLAQQTLGTNLNTLGAESYTKNFVDQLRSQAAGQPNPWVSLFAGMANAGAKNYTPAGKVPVNKALMPSGGGYNTWGSPLDAGNGLGAGAYA